MSAIEWTDATWNPVSGCTRVSAGCDHCYAVLMTHRLEAMGQSKYAGLTVLNPKGDRHFNGVVRTHHDALAVPTQWRKPRGVFVNSMADLFHDEVPFDFIDQVFAVMAVCPQHTFQILTKRPERMAEYLATGEPNRLEEIYAAWHSVSGSPAEAEDWPLPNVWLGTSVEDQAAADARIPHLLRCPAAVRFLSCEPLLGQLEDILLPAAIDHEDDDRYIDWVIVGGESGRDARPCDIAWIRSIVAESREAGVPVFVKQLGCEWFQHEDDFQPDEWPSGDARLWVDEATLSTGLVLRHPKGGDPAEWPEDLRVREFPKGVTHAK